VRPTPAAVDRRNPALDGVRALAVGLVIAYHGGVPGLRAAGFYGVDVFFVLSGFLITGLLLSEQRDTGGISFLGFWSRRARRLLPGLLVMLVVVEGYVTFVAASGRYPDFRADALSVLGYASNWHFISASSNYFSAAAAPSLLTHTWSLAIEEQFYVVWPLVVWGAVLLAKRARRSPASVVLVISGAGLLASAGWMAHLYRSGVGASRLYYGTDTHALSILTGCALGAVVALVGSKLNRRTATAVAVLATAGVVWAACSLGTTNSATFQGGFLAVSLLTAALLFAVVSSPSSLPARTLSLPPIAYVGRISYGMYLWYFPLFAVINRAGTGLSGPGLFAVRCGSDVAAAAISFHLVEQPLRNWRPPSARQVAARFGTLGAGAVTVLLVAALVVVGTPTASTPGTSESAAMTARVAPPPAQGTSRLLVFGDSTAATLGLGLALSQPVASHRLVLDIDGMFGCGLVPSAEVRTHGEAVRPPSPCRISSPPQDRWPALLRASIASFHPDVVLIAAGRWEVDSRKATASGPWIDVTQPVDAAGVRAQLDAAARIVLASGGQLALATAPCFSSGEQADGSAWPEDSKARLDAYNSVVRQVASGEARSHPGAVRVVDLESMLCPGGKFRAKLDGVTVRAPDGVHYPFFNVKAPNQASPDTLSDAEGFAAWIAPRILGALSLREEAMPPGG
jgi:peptidoglycan/LPS O-acetylase OafA/YrhL